MSTAHTATAQLTRLRHLGDEVELFAPLTDIDLADDLVSVAVAHRPRRLWHLVVELDLLETDGRPRPATRDTPTTRHSFATERAEDEGRPGEEETQTT